MGGDRSQAYGLLALGALTFLPGMLKYFFYFFFLPIYIDWFER